MLQREAEATSVIRVRPSTRIGRAYWSATRHLNRRDRRILGLWGSAHLGLAVLAWMSSWISGQRGIYHALLGIYAQWDYDWYRAIAAHGYFSGRSGGEAARAFLPGFPVVLAAVHLLVRNWVASGLLVSLVAGGVALVCIGRLGGERAALYLLTAPAAMYLAVGYSESLFLALALPAWMAAQRRDWPLAAVIAALAGLVRVNGLFLIVALLVAAATSERGKRLRAIAWSSFGFVGPAAYVAYLWAGTGSPTAWFAASNAGWGLHLVSPWSAWKTTWGMAFGRVLPPDRAAMFQVEIACILAAWALTLVLLRRHAWAEATYCGLAAAVLSCTTYYQAVPRAVLIMWPLYVLVARAAEKRPWVGQVYLWVCAPLAVVVAVYFFLGKWAV